MLKWSKRIDVSSLGQHIENYDAQEHISTKHVQRFLAVALFYDFDLSTVIRSLQGTYTSEFRNTFSTLASLCNTICDLALVQEIPHTLLVGWRSVLPCSHPVLLL